MEGLIIKQWKSRDGKPRFPVSEIKKRQKCFHEKQTEPQPGDPVVLCENCGKLRVDVDALRDRVANTPRWLNVLCNLRGKTNK